MNLHVRVSLSCGDRILAWQDLLVEPNIDAGGETSWVGTVSGVNSEIVRLGAQIECRWEETHLSPIDDCGCDLESPDDMPGCDVS